MINIQDTDYIYAVTLVRIWEKKLIPQQTFSKLYESGTFDDVMAAAHEAGYDSNVDYDTMLSQELQNTYKALKSIAPNSEVFDLFLIQNDYHNIKVLLRADALHQNMDRLLMQQTRISVEVLKTAVINRQFDDVTSYMKEAYLQGEDILASSHNPQLADVQIDHFMYDDLLNEAKNVNNEFLLNLFKSELDLTNLQMIFRIERMEKDVTFAKKTILSGGHIAKDSVVELANYPAEAIVGFYSKTIYKSVVEDARELTQIEMRCDEHIQNMLRQTTGVSFGIEPLIAYLLKKQEEIKRLRMLLVAKKNDISSAVLAERLGVPHA